jgi:hypothetical protein
MREHLRTQLEAGDILKRNLKQNVYSGRFHDNKSMIFQERLSYIGPQGPLLSATLQNCGSASTHHDPKD